MRWLRGMQRPSGAMRSSCGPTLGLSEWTRRSSSRRPSMRSFLRSTRARAGSLVARRTEMAEVDWWLKFGRAWSRITQQILPAFSDAVVANARDKAKALEHAPYLPPEAHT